MGVEQLNCLNFSLGRNYYTKGSRAGHTATASQLILSLFLASHQSPWITCKCGNHEQIPEQLSEITC
jgi:hypothetical protein